MSGCVGGNSRTVGYNGHRIDAGPHRYYSKYDRVIEWWLNILPLQGAPARDDIILQRSMPLSQGGKRRDIGISVSRDIEAPDPEVCDEVMLLRSRFTRIYFLKKFFDHPVSLSPRTLANLGFIRSVKIASSYLSSCLLPSGEPKNLEDFYISSFGRQLYDLFFKDFTQRAWGVPSTELPLELGHQRVRVLSVFKDIFNNGREYLLGSPAPPRERPYSHHPKLFLYPKHGCGQLWEEVALRIEAAGGEIHLNHEVIGFRRNGRKIMEARVRGPNGASAFSQKGDYYLSSMPTGDLVRRLEGGVPREVSDVAWGLNHRDHIMVCLLLESMNIEVPTSIKGVGGNAPDNWIYVQEDGLHVRRLMLLNNWSPYLVKYDHKILLGLEYNCMEDDDIGGRSDEELKRLAIKEIVELGFVTDEDVLDSTVIRSPKAYPCYSGSYRRFHVIRDFTDGLENLFLIGRNGMHRYHNQDHSMLSAMTAVDNIVDNTRHKDNIWSINEGREYIEG
jgi:protoporphyrinogen oxidase